MNPTAGHQSIGAIHARSQRVSSLFNSKFSWNLQYRRSFPAIFAPKCAPVVDSRFALPSFRSVSASVPAWLAGRGHRVGAEGANEPRFKRPPLWEDVCDPVRTPIRRGICYVLVGGYALPAQGQRMATDSNFADDVGDSFADELIAERCAEAVREDAEVVELFSGPTK